MDLTSSTIIVLISSLVIFYLGNIFAKSSSRIGDYFRIPRSVKGATFDAIASSLPELFVALFAVIFFNKFEVGIGTIVGSALFNLLLIPGICILVSPIAFKVEKKVVTREGIFYIFAVVTLSIFLIFFKVWSALFAVFLLLIYLFYVKILISHSKEHRKKNEKSKKQNINLAIEVAIFFTTMFVIGFATYFLTKATANISEILKISPVIIAFTITAAATSVPDTVISVANAKNGDLDDAVSNVFGSNTFDILVGLGLPLLLYNIFVGPVLISFQYLEIILGLLGTTVLVTYFLSKEKVVTKKHGFILLLLYTVFLGYVIFLSFV